MKIKLKTLYASPTKIYQVDEIGDFSDSEGKDLIKGRFGISLEPIKTKDINSDTVPIKKEVRPKNIKKKGKK